MELSIQIALDFVECTKTQKERFIQFLESKNWLPINKNKLWEYHFTDENNIDDVFKLIDNQVLEAKKFSSLYEIDYMIISDEKFFFNQLS